MSGRGGGGQEERRGGGPSDGPRDGPQQGSDMRAPGPRPAGGRPGRLTFEQVVAKDMHYSRLRLASLKARYEQRQKLLAELQQEGEDMAVQAAKRVAAELAASQQVELDEGPS
ncbi:hypothetical protein ACK3TF_001565 [Chlorella vulgaris]